MKMEKIKVKLFGSSDVFGVESAINEFIERENATIIGTVDFKFISNPNQNGNIDCYASVTYSVDEEIKAIKPTEEFVNVFINEETGVNKEFNSDRAIYEITAIMEDLITGSKFDEETALELIDEVLKVHYDGKDEK